MSSLLVLVLLLPFNIAAVHAAVDVEVAVAAVVIELAFVVVGGVILHRKI